jgi:hypothetical protein
MDQQDLDQGRQQLQSHIESFLSQILANNVPQVEYKRRFITLLEMSSKHRQNDLREQVCKMNPPSISCILEVSENVLI